MTDPYSSFRDWEKLGFHAALNVYGYDNTVRGTKRYRSNLNNRGTIYLEDYTRMNYLRGGQMQINNDSVGFWYHDSSRSLVVGFRGTDTADPERFLGFIPDGYKERLNETMNALNPLGIELPYNSFCSCDKPIRCEGPLSYEKVLEKTTKMICDFGVFHRGFDYNLYGRERQTFDYSISGGDIYRCMPNSDCNADQNILNANFYSDITNDPKHTEVFNWVLDRLQRNVIKQIRECERIIFAGHSLGGSLALFSFLEASQSGLFDPTKLYFTGFNSGNLKNFDKVNFPTDQNWRDRCHAHRIRKDIVSYRYGTKVPTYTYSRPDMTSGEEPHNRLSGPNIHGINTFKCSNYSETVTDNLGQLSNVLRTASRNRSPGLLSRSAESRPRLSRSGASRPGLLSPLASSSLSRPMASPLKGSFPSPKRSLRLSANQNNSRAWLQRLFSPNR